MILKTSNILTSRIMIYLRQNNNVRLLVCVIAVVTGTVCPVYTESTFFVYKDKTDPNRIYVTNVPKNSDMTIVVYPYHKEKYFNQNEKINEWIKYYSEMYGVNPSLIRAMVRTESNFKTDAVSDKGARGLMQLMPGTAKEMGVDKNFHPRDNIKGGVKYFRSLLDRFHRTDLALAAYNAGPKKVIDAGNRVPDILETKNYVQKVLKLYRTYTRYYNKYPNPKTRIIPVRKVDGSIEYTNIIEAKK